MFDVEEIRSRFPILGQKVYGRKLVYLDSAATSEKPQSVLDAEMDVYAKCNANVHRGVHFLSERTTEMYESARRDIARFIDAESPEEIVFTSGATASINLVATAWCSTHLEKGDNIVVSEMEHHSNLVPWQSAALRHGAELRVLRFDDEGRIRTDMLPSLIDSRTKVVAVTQASNTLGTIPDLGPIISAAHAVGAISVVDGCQGIVHIPTSVREMGCDFYAFSGHKIYGPNGIGVLYGRRELLDRMPPYMYGGEMVDKVSFEHTTFAPSPLKFEAGTPNYVGAIALGEAIRFVESLTDDALEHERNITRYAVERLSTIPGLRIFGPRDGRTPMVGFNVEGCDHYDIGAILDKLSIAVRTGHHCAYPVMQHYLINGMCRASFAVYTTGEEIDALVAGVERAVKMLRR